MPADEHERMLRERLAEAGARVPVGDRHAAWRRATRRVRQRRRRRAAASALSVALVALATMVAVPAAWDGRDEAPDSEVVLQPAPAEDVDPHRVRLAKPATPDDAPPAPPVPVPRDWETVELEGALITVPPEWAQLEYELDAAGDAGRVCPDGEPALVVAHAVRPAGCSPDAAAMPEGLVVASTSVAQDAVRVAADGERVALPGAPARGGPVAGSLLMSHRAADRDRDVLVLPGVGDGLVIEVVGADRPVAALAGGGDLAGDDAADERSRRVRRALATLRPVDGVDRDAVALGRGENGLVTVDGAGNRRSWEVPTPLGTATVPDRATSREFAAAVHAGLPRAELVVLAGRGSDVQPVHRAPSADDAGLGGDAQRRVSPEPVWAADRPYVAWLQPAEDGARLRVLGWHRWAALFAGDDPDTDATVALETPDGLEAPLAPVSWHEHAPGQTTLELGLRTAPEGFSPDDRWGTVLTFADDGGLQPPEKATLRPLNP